MPAHSIDLIAHRIGETQHTLPVISSVALGLFSLVLVVLPGAWSVVELFDTVAHEGAHALMGASLGHRILAVTIARDRSGLTASLSPGGFGGFLARVVGYLGPSGFGLGAAKLISVGHVLAALWVGLALLALLLLTMRNLYGVLIVAICAGGLLLLLLAAPVGAQIVVAYGVTWLLLLAGLRTAMSHGTGSGDARALTRQTHLPKFLWAGIWSVGTLLALAIGGRLLV
jgi:Peptidase M50B-like